MFSGYELRLYQHAHWFDYCSVIVKNVWLQKWKENDQVQLKYAYILLSNVSVNKNTLGALSSSQNFVLDKAWSPSDQDDIL